jgi:transcriptional accessory protein Tex/SPT6
MSPIESLKNFFWDHGELFSKVIQGKEQKGAKFSRYFSYSQPIRLIQSHHALELLQGRRDGFIRLSFKLPEDTTSLDQTTVNELSQLAKPEKTKLDKELILALREVAEKEAIALCVQNLREKLMAAPVGKKTILALDTRFRAGIKVAIIDNTGKFLDATHLNLYPPLKDWYGSIADLAKLAIKHHVELIGIGSGPAFRESHRLINELIKMYPDLKLAKRTTQITGAPSAVTVNNKKLNASMENPPCAPPASSTGQALCEGGNHSEGMMKKEDSKHSTESLNLIAEPPAIPAKELPEFEEAFQGAVSIARQLQDPFGELIKTDPTTINLGPYQQDVRPAILRPILEALIKDCSEKKHSMDSRDGENKNDHGSRQGGKSENNRKMMHEKQKKHSSQPIFNSAMADALAKLRTGEKA